MNDAERAFWHIRRLIGIADTDSAPEADAVIREEIKTCSLAGHRVSIELIKERLKHGGVT